MGLPVVHYHRETLWTGGFPLWNPYSNCGAPFLAQWGTMVLYPFSLFYVLFPLPWSLNIFCLGHLLLGGMGMFYLVRSWTGRPLGAAIAGTVFVFNGISMSCLVWANYVVALAWMPWLVFWMRLAWRSGGRPVLYAILIAACQLLAGAPEITVLTWTALGTLYVCDLLTKETTLRKSWVRFFSVATVAALLCAPQLIPFGELLAQSHRMGAFRPKEWAIPSTGWANLILPVFRYGPPSDEIPQMQVGQSFLISYYLGLAPLLLAAVALFRQRRHSVVGLWLLSVVCLLLAMGDNFLAHPVLGRWMPALYLTQFPVKFTLLLAFSVPFMAGLGAVHLLDSFKVRTLIAFSFILLASLMGVAFWGADSTDGVQHFAWVWPNAWVRAICLTVVVICLWRLSRPASQPYGVVVCVLMGLTLMFDGASHNRTLVPRMESSAFAPGLWHVQNTNAVIRIGESRAFLAPQSEVAIGSRRIQGVENRVIGRHLALWSHFNLLDGVPKVNGSSALPMRGQKEVERQIYRFRNPEQRGMLDFLGVSWVSGGEDPTVWEPRASGRGWVQVGAQPRFDEATNLLQRVFSKSFDPSREVWFSRELISQFAGRTGSGRVMQQTVEAHRIAATVDMAAEGVLTVAQSYSSNWKAWVNDVPVPLVTANAAFQAIPVPRGLSRIEIRYVDSGFFVGLVISFLAIVGVVWCWFQWPRDAVGNSQPFGTAAETSVTTDLPKAA